MTRDSQSRIHVLDSSRGIAALVVVVYHIPIIFGTSILPSSNNRFLQTILNTVMIPTRLGEQAVYYFMCLSGFVLTEFSYRNQISFSKWVAWRFIRLQIVYYTTLLLAFLILPQSLTLKIRTTDLLQTFIFRDSTIYSGLVPPLWSLVVEFIISVGLFSFINRKSKNAKRRCIILVLGYFLTYLIYGWGVRALIRSGIFFMLGIEINRWNQSAKALINFKVHSIVIAGCFLSILVSPRLTTLIQIVGIPMLVITIIRIRPSFMNWAPFRFLGSISFSLYATHWIALIFVRDFSKRNSMSYVVIWFVSLSACLVFASLFKVTIEKPAQTLSRKVLK